MIFSLCTGVCVEFQAHWHYKLIIEPFYKVYNTLGYGFLEKVYLEKSPA